MKMTRGLHQSLNSSHRKTAGLFEMKKKMKVERNQVYSPLSFSVLRCNELFVAAVGIA